MLTLTVIISDDGIDTHVAGRIIEGPAKATEPERRVMQSLNVVIQDALQALEPFASTVVNYDR